MANREDRARTWGDTFSELSAAHRDGEIVVEDLERLAFAAYMLGRDADCESAWTEAHQAWFARGDAERAARCAFWQALGLFFRGDAAPALGWVARGSHLITDRDEAAAHAWMLILNALPSLFQGDGESVHAGLSRAQVLADRFHDRDAAELARLCRGYASILQGRIAEGTALLDEVMVSVTASELTPMLAGIIYCQVVTLCQTVFDVRRAREWTDALTKWCDAQPGLVPFRGNCLVHRCEIFQLTGAWRDAFESAEQACESLTGPPAWDTLGSAYYQLAEIQRLRGDLAESEASYHQASLVGHDPEPGLSLLRLTQGRLDVAVAAIRRSLEEAHEPATRSRLLPAAVDVLLEANHIEAAADAANQLAEIAPEFASPYLQALAAHASGSVLLAKGEHPVALKELRAAQRSWRDLEAPYQVARVRSLIAMACRGLGDEASAELEFKAARDTFEKLGATPDIERLDRFAGSVPKAAGLLSPREREVLTLVATGKTNRAIADALVISEKTVGRHVSNIFTKLQLSSRAEATAYAYKHGMAR
jgi:DNA-binding NarL/FixJ family response regulator